MEPLIEYVCATEQWVTLRRFSYEDVHIPKGFNCDLSSVPRALWWFVAPFELSIPAPLCHDWLYRHGGKLADSPRQYTRAEADALFLKIMLEEGVPSGRARIAYYAVRLFGGSSWKK